MTANDGQVSAAVPAAGKSDQFADWLTESFNRAGFCLLASNCVGSRWCLDPTATAGHDNAAKSDACDGARRIAARRKRCCASGWSTSISEMR
jgi:hypothetical protein